MSRHRPFLWQQTPWCYRLRWVAHEGLQEAMERSFERAVLARCPGTAWLEAEGVWHLPGVPRYGHIVYDWLMSWYAGNLIGVRVDPDPAHVACYHAQGAEQPAPSPSVPWRQVLRPLADVLAEGRAEQSPPRRPTRRVVVGRS